MTAANAVERRVRMRDGVELWTSSSWVTDEDDDGEGRPALVLVHGGPGLWDYLEPVAACVAGAMTTHRYDQRGCGRSDRSDVQSMAQTVADLEELREASATSGGRCSGTPSGRRSRRRTPPPTPTA